MNFTYNSSYQSTIGTMPFQLMYGFPADTTGLQAKAHPDHASNDACLQLLNQDRKSASNHSDVQKAQQKEPLTTC